jgi:hypothetical protein
MIYTVSAIANLLKVTPSTVKQWGAEARLEIQQQQRGSVTAYIVEDDEFERFCRDNLNYLIFMVGGRVAPRAHPLPETVCYCRRHAGRSHGARPSARA